MAVVSATDDIYKFNDDPSPAGHHAREPSTGDGGNFIAEPEPAKRRRGWGFWNIVLGIVIVAFVAGIGTWAGVAGMRVRSELWRSTRSIRYDHDIALGYRFGNGVMRLAEAQAHLPAFSDANAPTGDTRRLTDRELLQGLVHYYDYIIEQHPDGKYELDYPPMRLAMMTLWVRHVQRSHPGVTEFPVRPNRRDTLLPQLEDFIQPMLVFNAVCDAVAAVGMFLLVWLWVARSMRGATVGRRVLPDGLIAFVVGTVGFWYALVSLVSMPVRPAPVVDLVQANPGANSSVIHGIINPQGALTTYQVDWGQTATYGQSTSKRFLGSFLRDVPVEVRMDKLPAGATIHYRLRASSPAGVSSTRDAMFVVGGASAVAGSSPVGGISWPGWTVWFRLLLIFLAMVISARMLPMPHRGWACGLVAGLLVWFDPVVLVDAHVWAQWDVWLLPFFVLAMLLASLEAWIWVGVLLGVGCLFKGQLLLGAPVLLIWPLAAGRVGAAVRLVAGLGAGAGVVLWPWLVPSRTAEWWIACVMIACVAVVVISFLPPIIRAKPNLLAMRRRPVWQRISWTRLVSAGVMGTVGAFIAFVLLFQKWPTYSPVSIWIFLLLLGVVALSPWFLRRRGLAGWFVLIFGSAIWIGSKAFGGNYSWMKLGFEYGAVKEDKIAMGRWSFANLPALLSRRFGWGLHDIAAKIHVAFPRPFGFHFDYSEDLQLRTVLVILYAICVLMCGVAAAIHRRRNDPRLLLALVAPWVLFPMILGQMSERYMLWGSALTAVCIAISTGLTLLHVLVAVAGTGMMLHQLLEPDPGRWPQLNDLFGKFYPDAAWMLLLVAGIFLWCAIAPSRRGNGVEG